MGSPQPPLILQIGADPTGWYVLNGDRAALTAQLSQAAGPVIVPVYAPLSGQLVVNPRSAGSVSLGPPAAGSGTHPSDDRFPGAPANLYVPSTVSPGAVNPGYPLLPGTDVAALQQQIVTAMRDGTVLPVPYGSLMSGNGTLVLSGSTLAFAVLSLPKPASPQEG